MRTYVTSTVGRARLAHIGTPDWIACGVRFRPDTLIVSETPPENRTVCPRCLKHYEPVAPNARERARARRRAEREARLEARERRILDALKQGKTFPRICREQDLSQRTVVRHVSRMRRRVGARSLFHFGYLVGLAERPGQE